MWGFRNLQVIPTSAELTDLEHVMQLSEKNSTVAITFVKFVALLLFPKAYTSRM